MWTIDKPLINALTTFDTCMTGIRDPDLHDRLLAARPHIQAAEAVFDAAASAGTNHLIVTATQVGAVSKAEMEMLYTRHMARGKSRGRDIYDELMMAAVNDLCPFCGHRSVSTLDHTLPKAEHPAFAVTPINLVPCCKDCNHGKGTAFSTEAAEQWLNAYYDDISADRWLYSEIVEQTPPVAIFFVHAPDNWDAITAAKVQNQYRKLNLAKLYASQAARQFQNTRRALREIHHFAGPEGVREDLNRRYLSCTEVMVNSWETAFYHAASISDWYCDGGFGL